jgi:hypothetical protein
MVKRLAFKMAVMWGLGWLLTAFPLHAQRPVLSDSATISLLTVSPGSELYTTFGHSAFRVVDKTHNLDRIYNYGTFNFDEPGFYLNFCRGKLDYMLSAYPYAWAEAQYIEEERSIIQQKLNLTPELKNYLFQFLEWNHLPQNRRYRYDFFFDNCATRIRDVFEKTFGPDVELFLNTRRQWTFRQYLDLYLKTLPFSDYGIDLALGAKTDRIATPHEAMFLPDYLFEAVQHGKIKIDNQWQPLVARVDTLHFVQKGGFSLWMIPWVHILTTIILLLTLYLTARDIKIGRPMPAKLLDYLLFAYNGLIGIVLLLLWFATDHTSTADNWNVFWAWPTSVLILPFLRNPEKRIALKWYFLVFAGIMALVLAAWPWIPQDLHEANIPLILALAVRSLYFAEIFKWEKLN